MTLKFDGWPWKIIGHPFYAALSLVHHFKAIGESKLELQSGNAQFWSKSEIFCPVLKFDGWPWKTIGHLFYVASSFMHPFIAISEFKLKLQSGNPQFGSKSAIFCPVWPWNLTDDLEKNRAPLLCYFKLCASFHHHMWIWTGVTVQKRLSWVMTSVTLTFYLWPWPFVWTSLLSLVITSKNFVMMRWWEQSQKGVTDRQTDGRTDGRTEPFIELLGHS